MHAIHSENPQTSREHVGNLLRFCEKHWEIDFLSSTVSVNKPIVCLCMYELGLEK